MGFGAVWANRLTISGVDAILEGVVRQPGLRSPGMPSSSELFTAVGRAAGALIDASALGDEPIRVDAALVEQIQVEWVKQGDPASRRQELELLLRAPAGEIDSRAAESLRALGMALAPEAVQTLRAYFRQIPRALRRAIRRPSDPVSQSLPATLGTEKPVDLQRWLPIGLPWFEIGDRPFGVGDWELLELVDHGRWGEAWKAGDTRGGDLRATLYFFLRPEWKSRARQQAKIQGERWSSLSGTVPWLGIDKLFVSADPPCLQSPYSDMVDLRGLLWDLPGPGPHAMATDIARGIAEALAAGHRLRPALLHGALDPAAVLVAKKADGGFSTALRYLGLGAGLCQGDEPSVYASPQVRRGQQADARDDLFALGVLWYQLLMGDLSLGRPSGAQWRRRLAEGGVAPGAIELLESCLEDEPGDRPVDAEVFLARLSSAGPVAPAPMLPARRRAFDAGSLLDAVATPAPAPAAAGTTAPVDSGSRRRRASVQNLFESIEREVNEQAKTIVNAVGMKLVLLPQGTFQMGSPETEPGRRDNEGPLHEVSLTKAFYMGAHPVTQAAFARVMGRNPSRFNANNGGGPEHPVESVTWEEAVEFCRRLSELPDEKTAGRKYRLPTEAEWEYACRAGSTSAFCFGASLGASQANFDGRFPEGGAKPGFFLEKTTQVGAYPANNFGLHDMHGNVWEWCADWHDSDAYRHSVKRNPQGPAAGRYRVLRGGSWRCHAVTCRSAYRNGLSPGSRDRCTGFRVVVEGAG